MRGTCASPGWSSEAVSRLSTGCVWGGSESFTSALGGESGPTADPCSTPSSQFSAGALLLVSLAAKALQPRRAWKPSPTCSNNCRLGQPLACSKPGTHSTPTKAQKVPPLARPSCFSLSDLTREKERWFSEAQPCGSQGPGVPGATQEPPAVLGAASQPHQTRTGAGGSAPASSSPGLAAAPARNTGSCWGALGGTLPPSNQEGPGGASGCLQCLARGWG